MKCPLGVDAVVHPGLDTPRHYPAPCHPEQVLAGHRITACAQCGVIFNEDNIGTPLGCHSPSTETDRRQMAPDCGVICEPCWSGPLQDQIRESAESVLDQLVEGFEGRCEACGLLKTNHAITCGRGTLKPERRGPEMPNVDWGAFLNVGRP